MSETDRFCPHCGIRLDEKPPHDEQPISHELPDHTASQSKIKRLYRSGPNVIASLDDLRAVLLIDDKARFYPSLQEYRSVSNDTSAWDEASTDPEKQELYKTHAAAFDQLEKKLAFHICWSCDSKINNTHRVCPACGVRVNVSQKEAEATARFREHKNTIIGIVTLGAIVLAIFFIPFDGFSSFFGTIGLQSRQSVPEKSSRCGT